ncbi:MAG: histidine kinase [Ferruginibacter sp.]
MKKLLNIQIQNWQRFFILHVTCMCCFFSVAKSQEYSYKHYDIKDGLVGNNVYYSVQDKEGFLWFATETGVSRFDGTSFKNFTTAEGLPDNEVLKLFVDSKGRVWMLPYKNTVCYYYKGKIYNQQTDTTLKLFKIQQYIQNMFEDKDGNLFFVGEQTLIVLTAEKKVFVIPFLNNGKWMIMGGGINSKLQASIILGDTVQVKQYLIKVTQSGASFEEQKVIRFWGFKVSHFYMNPNLMVYNNNFSNVFESHSLVLDNYLQDGRDTITVSQPLNLISFPNDSIVFFNTQRGVFEFNYRTKKYSNTYIQNENVSFTLKDHEADLWFTTLGKGIFKLSSTGNRNIVFRNEVRSRKPVESVVATNGHIIIGSDANSIYDYNKKTGVIASVKLDAIPGNRISKIKVYKGSIYFLTENSLLKSDTSLDNIQLHLSTEMLTSYKDFDINDSGVLFFASHAVSYYMNEKDARVEAEGTKMTGSVYNKTLTKRWTNPNFHIFYLERSTAVCATDSGIYLGTLLGLKFFDRNKKMYSLGDKFPLLSGRITKMLVSKDKLWVGTNDEGVICYDGKKIVKKISTKEGLTGSLIRALYADSNYLWIGTDRGLNKISLHDTGYRVLQKYTSSDGLLSDMINCIYTERDTLYVGTPEGLSFFNEHENSSNSICDLKILDVTVSGKNFQFDSSKTLVLKNKDNNIRFDFVAISFKADGDILYYYKLSAIDSDWKTTRENFLQYPTLPSGNYTMLLYAVNKFGVKSKMVTINFEIGKKLVEKTWFIVLMILLATAIVWLLANWQIRKTKKKQHEKMANAGKIAQLEQQALKAQMNPHFIFNCLNSIQQYVIDKDILGANKFISGFSKLIRQTLDNSGKESITVAEEESFLRSYLELEKSRFEEKFDYNIHIDEHIQKDVDSLPPMLLQPYIENCIRHGIMHKSNGKGIIDIRFDLSGGKLACTVIDNGIGRLAANTYKRTQDFNYQSRGTDITWQRIKMINMNKDSDIILQTEDLTDLNNKPCGTKVTIVVPFKKPY